MQSSFPSFQAHGRATPARLPLRRTLAALILGLPLAALAHSPWLMPSAPNWSGKQAWVTVDGAISEELFAIEHQPLKLDTLQITGPGGKPVALPAVTTTRQRSSLDLNLQEDGTYVLSLVQQGFGAMWQQDGQPRRWRGTEAEWAEKGLAQVPESARASVKLIRSSSRIESFVTLNKPSALPAVQGRGLEMRSSTALTDLVQGEATVLRFTLDGKPAADLAVTLKWGGQRFGAPARELLLKTNAQGELAITWKDAGVLRLSAQAERDTSATERQRDSYVATLDVAKP